MHASVLCDLQHTETRRITHISAEQKRRFNIKLGFDTLHSLVTTLSSQPSIKVKDVQVVGIREPNQRSVHTPQMLDTAFRKHHVTDILQYLFRSVKPPPCRRRPNTSARCNKREPSCRMRPRDSERRSRT